ncbi:MAG: hypothetical protein ABW173_06905 [Sphingomonas sp.]
MLFPFRSSAIFRNRWIALLWAIGICFTASEIVDSLSSVTNATLPATVASQAASSSMPPSASDADHVYR